MPRRTKKKAAKSTTYYKAKNGRFYKKVEIDGKLRVRFVSNAEATGTIKTKAAPKKRKAKKPVEPKPEPVAEAAEEKAEVTSE